jgi:HAD superfamily hydrolase (TIGR01662 family)
MATEATRKLIYGRPKLVIFDAGGVLVTPPLHRYPDMTEPRLSFDEIRRTFYATFASHFQAIEQHLIDFWQLFGNRVGLTAEFFAAFESPEPDALIRWSTPVPGAVETLAKIKAHNIPVAIASNAAGDVVSLLDEAAVCHVGTSGNGVEIDVIFDSGDVSRYPDETQSRKPQPTMLNDALAHLGVAPEEALFIGDAIWADVYAAQRAGVPVLHLDPYGDCEDTVFIDDGIRLASTEHDHVHDIRDVTPYALGHKPRTIANSLVAN